MNNASLVAQIIAAVPPELAGALVVLSALGIVTLPTPGKIVSALGGVVPTLLLLRALTAL